MKRLVSMVLSVIMVISLLPLGTLTVSASAFAGGDGSLENPYQISTAEQLNSIRNDLDAHYILMNDISLSSSWHTIEGCFTGTFEGNNKTINGLSFNKSDDSIGFFEECKGNVFNLYFNNVTVKISEFKDERRELYYGIIASKLTGGELKNCSVSGKIDISGVSYRSYLYLGGIVGRSYEQTRITECKFIGEINLTFNSYSYVRCGGISGENGGTIKYCDTDTKLWCNNKLNDTQPLAGSSSIGYFSLGGIVGSTGNNLVEECNANANFLVVNESPTTIGGILGAGSGASKCIVTGTVSCDANGNCKIGGIGGSIYQILDCYAECTITCDKNNNTGYCREKRIGGLVGEFGKCIQNSAFVGDITVYSHSKSSSAGNVYLGGLSGVNQGSKQTIENCYARGHFYGECTSGTDASQRHSGRVHIGGLIGSAFLGNDCSLEKSYFSGTLDGYADLYEYINSIVGDSVDNCEIKNCYYNSDLHSASAQKEYGKNSNSLKLESTFANWDFNKDWIIKSNFNEGYPTLRAFFEGLFIEGVNTVQNNKETILKAVRYDENGNVAPEGGIVWSCSDESVAQITPWGNNVTVKGLKGGKATITATHAESGQKADFEIEVVSYVMTLAGGYTVMLDEELEINYAVKQGEEYVHNDLDIKWEIESKDSNNAVKIISDKDNAYTRALTIKGINEGECELVAKVDGAELGRTKIEVLGNLADTIEQEVVLRAKILKDNSQYKYYKNNFTDLPEMFTKDMNKTPAVLYNAINDVFKSPTDRTNFYEIVLLDILTDGESTKLLGELGNIVDNKIVQHATKQIGNLDFDTNASSADTTVKKMFDELLDETDDVGKVKVGDVLSGLYTGKKMVNTYIDTVASTYSLGLVSNSQIKVLEDIKNNTTNSNLKEACDNVLDMYYKSSKDGVSYAAQLGMVESGYDGLEFAIGQLIDTVCKLNWVSALYKGAFDVGTTVSNLAYNADDLSAQTLTLIAYAEIGDCLKEAVAKAESNFNSKEDLASASKFMALADTYKVCLLKGCDSSYNLVETTKETEETSKTFETAVFGVLGLAKNAITGLIDLFNDNKDYDHSMKTITNIKKNISVADFYSTEGTDIVEYLREVKSTTPSEWAKPEIEKAKNYGFLPDYMQNNYQNNITRAEFCTILTWMIEEKTGKSIGQLIEEKGTPIKSPFEDTYYEYADYMCKLGIVNGVSATEFNPLGEITREQAATMLARTAKVLGYDTYSNSNVESSVSSWAKDSVAFVNDKNIMNGTSKGFEPKGKYTKEQAIATFVRMYEKLK